MEVTEQAGDVIARAFIEADRSDIDFAQLFLRFKWLTHDETPNLSENFVGIMAYRPEIPRFLCFRTGTG